MDELRTPPGPGRFDSSVLPYLSRHRIPGLSIAAARKGELVEARGYGLANVEHQTPATADTVYQIASVGKQFTAALVLMLSERRLLSLDENNGSYFGVDAWEGSNRTSTSDAHIRNLGRGLQPSQHPARLQ